MFNNYLYLENFLVSCWRLDGFSCVATLEGKIKNTFVLFKVFFKISTPSLSVRASVGMLRVSTAVAITVFPFVAWLYYYIHKELRSNWPSHCQNAI